MLIYGICMSEIKDSEIDWDKVEKLLESYDSSLHGDFKEYANIYGEDYDSLSTSLENLLRSWSIAEPSEPVSELEVEVLWWWYYMCRIL